LSVWSMLKPCFKLKMKSFLFINLIKNSLFPYLNLSQANWTTSNSLHWIYFKMSIYLAMLRYSYL
jgi:hypothetical protein